MTVGVYSAQVKLGLIVFAIKYGLDRVYSVPVNFGSIVVGSGSISGRVKSGSGEKQTW